jgi:hypothetical protein
LSTVAAAVVVSARTPPSPSYTDAEYCTRWIVLSAQDTWAGTRNGETYAEANNCKHSSQWRISALTLTSFTAIKLDHTANNRNQVSCANVVLPMVCAVIWRSPRNVRTVPHTDTRSPSSNSGTMRTPLALSSAVSESGSQRTHGTAPVPSSTAHLVHPKKSQQKSHKNHTNKQTSHP